MKKVILNIKFFFIWLINSVCELRLDTEVSNKAFVITLVCWFVILTKITGLW
jgi:hypothetical protein